MTTGRAGAPRKGPYPPAWLGAGIEGQRGSSAWAGAGGPSIGTMATGKRPKTKTVQAIKTAQARARDLGPINPVEPAERRGDGSPRAGAGQVYVMKTGTVFHPAWCQVVAEAWDSNPARVLVIREAETGQRRQCRSCDEPLGY